MNYFKSGSMGALTESITGQKRSVLSEALVRSSLKSALKKLSTRLSTLRLVYNEFPPDKNPLAVLAGNEDVIIRYRLPSKSSTPVASVTFKSNGKQVEVIGTSSEETKDLFGKKEFTGLMSEADFLKAWKKFVDRYEIFLKKNVPKPLDSATKSAIKGFQKRLAKLKPRDEFDQVPTLEFLQKPDGTYLLTSESLDAFAETFVHFKMKGPKSIVILDHDVSQQGILGTFGSSSEGDKSMSIKALLGSLEEFVGDWEEEIGNPL